MFLVLGYTFSAVIIFTTYKLFSMLTGQLDEYDAMGNWVKRTRTTDGKPKELTERVYEYY